MKKHFKLSLIMVVALILIQTVMFSSCNANNTKMTNEEAIDILKELVPASQELNKIYWGEKPELQDKNAEIVGSVTGGQYYRVSEEFPYQTVEELKEASEKVFSKDYLENIYVAAFDGYEYSDDENTYTIYARYKNDDDGKLCYNLANTTFYSLNTEIDIDSAKVVSGDSNKIKIAVDITTKNSSGENNKNSMNITIVKQEEGWRLDSPTY